MPFPSPNSVFPAIENPHILLPAGKKPETGSLKPSLNKDFIFFLI